MELWVKDQSGEMSNHWDNIIDAQYFVNHIIAYMFSLSIGSTPTEIKFKNILLEGMEFIFKMI